MDIQVPEKRVRGRVSCAGLDIFAPVSRRPAFSPPDRFSRASLAVCQKGAQSAGFQNTRYPRSVFCARQILPAAGQQHQIKEEPAGRSPRRQTRLETAGEGAPCGSWCKYIRRLAYLPYLGRKAWRVLCRALKNNWQSCTHATFGAVHTYYFLSRYVNSSYRFDRETRIFKREKTFTEEYTAPPCRRSSMKARLKAGETMIEFRLTDFACLYLRWL